LTISHLIEFWKAQGITSTLNGWGKIDDIEQTKNLLFPEDFKQLYLQVNGMENLYPNETDAEGFLFYPVEAIIPATNEFKIGALANMDNVFIFAEYLHKSWWYGFEIINNDEYVIGIIPHENKFKPITNSLAEFIELYMEDSERLYDYE
jgi:hypothetical protein